MVFRCAYRPVSTDAGDWAALLFGLSGRRAERLWRLRGRSLAQSMSAEALCLELIGELRPGYELRLEEDETGKPFVPGSALFVSISHSGGFAAAAAADVPVGIDLQELRMISDRVLNRLYSPEERRWISAGDSTRRAVRLWTMKEAYGKLRGDGIFAGKPFAAAFHGEEPETRYDGVCFHFPDAPDGLLLTVCLACPPNH